MYHENNEIIYDDIFGFGHYITSCIKEGPEGPVGPVGEQGEQGEQGEFGNANVTSYLFENQNVSHLASNPFSLPALTQSVLDYGLVLGYFSNPFGPPDWFTLPFKEGSNELNITSITLGTVQIFSSFDFPGLDFRFVVIEGNDGSGSKGKSTSILDELKSAGIDIANYQEVADHFGLDF